METDLALHRWAQALFSFMVMGLRTNHVLAQALRDELRLEKRLTPEDITAILERPGIMASATRCGNHDEAAARQHIVDLYCAVASCSHVGDIRDSWQRILSGRVEMVDEVQRCWRKKFILPSLGEFKVYYTAKCLKTRFGDIEVRSVVGSNLRPDRNSGAFATVYSSKLAANLGRVDLDLLLAQILEAVKNKLTLMHAGALAAVLTEEIIEHVLCECTKARRLRNRMLTRGGKTTEPLPMDATMAPIAATIAETVEARPLARPLRRLLLRRGSLDTRVLP